VLTFLRYVVLEVYGASQHQMAHAARIPHPRADHMIAANGDGREADDVAPFSFRQDLPAKGDERLVGARARDLLPFEADDAAHCGADPGIGQWRSSWLVLREPFSRLGRFSTIRKRSLRRTAPPIRRREVTMSRSVLRVSIIALGVATFVSSSPLSAARADTSAQPAPAPSAPAPSLAQPAPTPDFWVESGPDGATVAQHPVARRHARHYARHYASRDGRRYGYYSDNPVASAATGMAGGVADLGSLAAYPFYCFPNYASCSVRWPYRF
jgi:hypothetical protein